MPELYEVTDLDIEQINYDECEPFAFAHDARCDDDVAFLQQALDGCSVAQCEMIYL